MGTIREVLEEGDTRKKRSVEALKKELGTFRTGRANPALIENVIVDYYGTSTPLNQLASITVAEARLLRKGNRLCVSEVEIRDGESGRLNAKARVTCALAPGE